MKLAYLITFITTMAAGLVPVGVFNSMVDSLWHFQGNQIVKQNFPFDERIAKTNRLLNTYKKADYNCILLGSSRTIALREEYLEKKGDRCFNYSVRGGRVEEYIVFSRFIKSLGIEPQRVYVAIDGFNFTHKFRSRGRKIQDDMIRTGEMPTIEPVYRAYLSWDVLAFNYQMNVAKREQSRITYDETLQGRIRENLPDYKPKFEEKWKSIKCNTRKSQYYVTVKNIFPKSEIIGYVPPISPWKMFTDFYQRNMANCVLENIAQIADEYDGVYDFSMPSAVTENTIHSYDGSHFDLLTQIDIASVLIEKPQAHTEPFGYRVLPGSSITYPQEFHRRIEYFLIAQEREDLWKEYLKRVSEEKTASKLKKRWL